MSIYLTLCAFSSLCVRLPMMLLRLCHSLTRQLICYQIGLKISLLLQTWLTSAGNMGCTQNVLTISLPLHLLHNMAPYIQLLLFQVYNFSPQSLFSFLSELLLNKQLGYFQSWVYPLSHELIFYSIRNPLVSGFYRLLSVAMKIAKKIKYYRVIFLLVKSGWINFIVSHIKYF